MPRGADNQGLLTAGDERSTLMLDVTALHKLVLRISAILKKCAPRKTEYGVVGLEFARQPTVSTRKWRDRRPTSARPSQAGTAENPQAKLRSLRPRSASWSGPRTRCDFRRCPACKARAIGPWSEAGLPTSRPSSWPCVKPARRRVCAVNNWKIPRTRNRAAPRKIRRLWRNCAPTL